MSTQETFTFSICSLPGSQMYISVSLVVYVKYKRFLSELCHDCKCIRTIVLLIVGTTRIRGEKRKYFSVSVAILFPFFTSSSILYSLSNLFSHVGSWGEVLIKWQHFQQWQWAIMTFGAVSLRLERPLLHFFRYHISQIFLYCRMLADKGFNNLVHSNYLRSMKISSREG